ncbi:hypothetical protein DNTS_018977 [Danionella cerebrum]|uniref:Angiomotin C-terminal domain-containing protein n=1 Tax=Danionella cerebrum TaxID=2873325 RepID=A0A553QP35_9TELE|nr:hypothetical protein DNTS_018977 [Danionella translucida]
MLGEEASGTVLHRLIQEQLRYGDPTDARSLLAIQQQALRRGGECSSGGASSSESLSQDESHSPQLSARQEPQGQEHQVDYQHSENYKTYPHREEELPTYEQAKAQSQYLTSQWCAPHQACSQKDNEASKKPCEQQDNWEIKQSHERSHSERLVQFAMESNSKPPTYFSSHPQINGYHANQYIQYSQQGLEYKRLAPHTDQHHYSPPPSFHSQHNRLPTADVCHRVSTSPPAGREVSTYSQSQLEMLLNENKRLRQELEGHTEKALRIQKLEQEIQRISEAYGTLMKGCAKRETLEQTLRNKLMAEIKRLQQSNIQAAKEVEAADQNQHAFEKLLMQSEEQQLRCSHLEEEIEYLQGEAEKHQLRSEALENTLRSTQSRSQQLWTELQKKRAYVQKVERLQAALTQLQATCEKREGLETRLRTRLEQELRSLRNQQHQPQSSGGAALVNVCTLQELLREKEERILSLETDKTRWEQKFLEEKTMREFAMDAAATAAAQRDTTIINHSPCHSFIEELPSSELRNQEVENRIRALYAQILEKDTVITFLKHKLQKRESGDSITNKEERRGNDRAVGLLCHASVETPAQMDIVLSEKQTTDETHSTEPKPPMSTQKEGSTADIFKGLDVVAAEAVEIFI